MPAIASDLVDIAASQDTDPADVIAYVLDRLGGDDGRRTEFLQGLTNRVIDARQDPENGIFEVHKWIGSWMLSLDLLAGGRFDATDDEAEKLLDAGKLGNGMTSKDLRTRYGR